jgi:adenylate cyclase
VIVSNAVFQKLASKLEIPARNLGLLPLRNMTTPVKAYLLRFGQVEQPSRTVASMGTLPSIAVLPFQNMNGSLDDDYFCDGVVEDIVISLANLRELVVISRASTLSFGREKPDFQSLGASLGVQYVLGGALRRGPQGIAMSAELVEAETGETLWVDKFKGKLDEIFDIQDEIVERVVSGIAPTVRTREMRRALRKRPETYSAYENTLRALDIIGNLDIDTFGEARAYLERAIDADPSFAMAYAWAARSRSIQIGQGWSQDRAQDAQEALELAKRAIDLDPDNALALATFGHLRSFLFHDYDGAVVHLERARAASPNSAYAWIVSSATESYLGRGDAAIGMAERSIRLYPKGRELFYYYNFFSIAHYVAGNYEESLRWARMSEIEHPLFTSNMRMLCASLAAVGDFRAAHQIADRLIAVEPNFTLDDYEVGRMPFKPDGLRAGFLEHLRSAGLAV